MARNQRALARLDRLGAQAGEGVLSTLLALVSDAVLAVDGFRRVIMANDQASHVTGLTVEELLDTDVCDVLFDPDRALVPVPGTLDEVDYEPQEGPLPFPTDGSLCTLSCRLARGGSQTVQVRCDRASAPGETYVVAFRPVDAAFVAEQDNDRLVQELTVANRRLSGTLRIVLDTIDAHDMGSLFDQVLEQIAETMDASGTLLFLAEADGFRLRGRTRSLEGRRVPQFMAYGEGIETLVTRSGHALRLHLVPPSEGELRAGALETRELIDEESGATRRVPARQVPPFSSFVCVPVWFGGHVIALIEVGWNDARSLRRDDARLLDSVAQYLSVELMAALSAIRSEHAERLDAAAEELLEDLRDLTEFSAGQYQRCFEVIGEVLDAECADVAFGPYQSCCVVTFADGTTLDLPVSLDDLVRGHAENEVAVVEVCPGTPLFDWLAKVGRPSRGALLDVGTLLGKRRCLLALRPVDAEPLEDVDLAFLRRVGDDARVAVLAGEERSKDARISQALQGGMRNELQRVEGVTAHGLYSSATEAAFVGGDFYDLIRLPRRRACVILGDVSGKGVEAASVSAAVKTALGAYAWEGLPPAHMVRLLNDFLLGFSRVETFATLFVGMVDLDAGTLTYCSAGHPPALLLRASTGELETLDEQSGVVGAFKGMAYRDGRAALGEGDVLFLYTDGVTEARDPQGGFFGEDGLRDAVMREERAGFDGLLERLLATIDAYTERRLDDDVAMVAVRFDELGAGGAASADEGETHDHDPEE